MSFLSLRLAQIIPRMYNPIIVQKVASSAGCLWSSANFLIEALMSSLFGGMNKSAPNHVKCEHWQRVRWRLVWLWTCKIMVRRWLDVGCVDTITDSSWAGIKTIPDWPSVHTMRRSRKLEQNISDRFCATLWCSVNRYSESSGSEQVGERNGTHWGGSKYSGKRTGI